MTDQQEWLELSLIISGELAEAVSDVLTRFLSDGVVIEKAVAYEHLGEISRLADETRICGYIPVDDKLVETRSAIEQALWHLGNIQSLPEIHYQIIENQNWMEKWKEQYHPIIIGKKLLILPPWLDNPYPQRIPIRIDPNMAFGTGTHPTTQLCLKLTEKYLKPGMDVIDIGCGSGILSIAARLLGTHQVLAVDIDPLSVKATQDNAALNGIREGIETGLGSVAEIKQKKYSIQKAEIVLANILAPVIITLMSEGMAELVKPGGNLILSGILDHQANDVTDVVSSYGFMKGRREQIEDWVSLAFIHQST